MNKFKLMLLATILAWGTQASAVEHSEFSVVAQNGAYAGYAGLGLEWAPNENYHLSLVYGHTPKWVGGHTIESYTLKNEFHFLRMEFGESMAINPYVGLIFIYSPDSDLFVQLPKQYPDYYYPPTAIRAAFTGGIEWQLNKTLTIALEYAVLDSELAYLQDSHRFDSRQMGSGGFLVKWGI